jgi:hypothetical protein
MHGDFFSEIQKGTNFSSFLFHFPFLISERKVLIFFFITAMSKTLLKITQGPRKFSAVDRKVLPKVGTLLIYLPQQYQYNYKKVCMR